MDLNDPAQLIAEDLAALGRLGDPAVSEAASRLAAALASPVRSRVLDLLGQIAVEIDPLPPGVHAELRVSGNDASIVLVGEPAQEPAHSSEPGEPDTDARITLRLPTALKAQIERAAAAEGVSVNAYVIRRLSDAPRVTSFTTGRRRMTGYGRS